MTVPTSETFTEIKIPANPFPGLRPFDFNESHLFFGRDGQSERLVDKLGCTRFLAVVGTSGSGKSSLVRAGLLPALLGGFMTSAGSNWRIAILRPGNDPIGKLAIAINARDVFGSEEEENQALQIALTEATLRRGNRGLLDVVYQNAMADDENLLVVVDQFEELFRFAREASRKSKEIGEHYQNDAAAFVKLLLEAHSQRKANIYVVLTMRSDFLGDCSQFWKLPEAVNEGQYLIPRLARDQLREAITAPIAVAGGQITSRLVSRLLNDVGADHDQLPVLQHLLMRVWDEWKERRLQVEAEVEGNRVTCLHKEVHEAAAIDLCCYEAVGGMSEALSRHADEACNELPNDQSRELAQKLFKRLTEKGPDNREIRCPITLSEICAVAEAGAAELKEVIETFRRPDRSFLKPPFPRPLADNSLIDISHESLIRGWSRLKEWVENEADLARDFRRLADTAVLYKQGKAGLLRDPELQQAVNWVNKAKPNEYWSRRYHPEFDAAMNFLNESLAARETEVKASEKRRRNLIWLAYGVSIVLAVAFAFAAFQGARAKRALDIIEREGEKQRQVLYDRNISFVQSRINQGLFGQAAESLDRISDPDAKGLRRFEFRYLWRLLHSEGLTGTLSGHTAGITSITLSPSGKILATGSEDATVKLWDTQSQKEFATLTGHTAGVYAVAFSADGKLLASGGDDNTVKLWDAATYQVLATLEGHDAGVYSLAVSPNGKILASASDDKTVRLWDIASRHELATLTGHTAGVYSLAFSPDGKILVSGSEDNSAKLWDVKTQRQIGTLLGHSAGVYSLAFSPKGNILATGSNDSSVKLWNTTTRQQLAALRGHSAGVTTLAFSHDGQSVATGSDDATARLWDIGTSQELMVFKGHTGSVSSLVLTQEGRTLATGSWDRTVKLWDTSTREELLTLVGHEAGVSSLAFFPDGQTLASASDDETVRIWNTVTRQQLATLSGNTGGVYALAVSQDGKFFASSGEDNTVRLWAAATRQQLAIFAGHAAGVYVVAFSPDGKILASASEDNTVRLWNTETRQPLAVLSGHAAGVYALAFSPDGKMLASGGEDNTIRLWATTPIRQLEVFTGHSSGVYVITFSPDGKILASGSEDHTVKFWDITTRRALATLEGHIAGIYALAFSPDGKTLATGSNDYTVKLWDTGTLEELLTLTGHAGRISSIAFASDGKMLATASWDKSVKLWLTTTEDHVMAPGK